ncbi:hypothetical protein ACFP65_02140 [Marinilactibacillus sp. GCM10026970]
MAYARGFIESFTNDLDEMIGDRGNTLLEGQRQRMNIVKNLLKNPKI